VELVPLGIFKLQSQVEIRTEILLNHCFLNWITMVILMKGCIHLWQMTVIKIKGHHHWQLTTVIPKMGHLTIR